MQRRGFLKAMVAAAAGLMAATPRVVWSLQAGTLTPAWTKEQQMLWTAHVIEDEQYRGKCPMRVYIYEGNPYDPATGLSSAHS